MTSVPITLVVPVLNEAKSIERMLRSVRGGTVLPSEILIIDGGSTDDTRKRACRVLDGSGISVRFIHNPRRRVQHALNLGLSAARYPILMRLDGHCTVNERYVETLYSAIQDGSVVGAGGVKRASGRSSQGQANAVALNSRLGVGNSSYHYCQTVALADHIPFGTYRVEALREVGGWNPELDVNQDYELDFRLGQRGYELVLDPAASIDWSVRESAVGLFRQHRRYGRGKAAVLRLHPRSTRARHAIPTFVYTGGALLAVVAPGAVVVAGATLYASLYGAMGFVASEDADSVAAPRVGVALAAMHSGYALGVLEGLFGRAPQQSQTVASGDWS